MKRAGLARRRALVRMCPPASLIVDVGADHGHVAHAVGGLATERAPGRSGRADVPWVIADGLAPFRHVPVAVIAGMGAHTIAGILERGPRPEVLVCHAPDDPQWLRRWLAGHGWRIDDECLAPEANRWAEILRAVPGEEEATGWRLAYGPRLLDSDDPYLRPHLAHHQRYHEDVARRARGRDPARSADAWARARFLEQCLTQRGWWPPAADERPARDAEAS